MSGGASWSTPFAWVSDENIPARAWPLCVAAEQGWHKLPAAEPPMTLPGHARYPTPQPPPLAVSALAQAEPAIPGADHILRALRPHFGQPSSRDASAMRFVTLKSWPHSVHL